MTPGDRGRAARRAFWDADAAVCPKRTHRACGKADGETCHVERWFGTLRARTSRLVRRTFSFSKPAENHLAAIHLSVPTYPLAVQQKTTARA